MVRTVKPKRRRKNRSGWTSLFAKIAFFLIEPSEHPRRRYFPRVEPVAAAVQRLAGLSFHDLEEPARSGILEKVLICGRHIAVRQHIVSILVLH